MLKMDVKKNHVRIMWKFLGGGVIKDPLGMEIPKGWGVQTKKPSVGGVWIFSGTTQSRKRSPEDKPSHPQIGSSKNIVSTLPHLDKDL